MISVENCTSDVSVFAQEHYEHELISWADLFRSLVHCADCDAKLFIPLAPVCEMDGCAELAVDDPQADEYFGAVFCASHLRQVEDDIYAVTSHPLVPAGNWEDYC